MPPSLPSVRVPRKEAGSPRRILAWEMDTATCCHRCIGPQPECLFGHPVEAWQDPGFWRDHVHPEDLEGAEASHRTVLQDGGTLTHTYRFRRPDGRHAWAREDVQAAPGPSGPVLAGFLADITPEKDLEQRLRVQNCVTSLLANAETLDAAAPLILKAIGMGSDWVWGSYWSVDPSDQRLRLEHWWHAEDFAPEVFQAATERIRFAPANGLPGLAWSTGQPQWMEDLSVEDNFLRREAADQSGLRSGVAFPVRMGDHVLGVMTFFAGEVRPPDPHFLDMLASLGSQIGQFVERRRAEAALVASETRYRAVLEQASEGMFLVDLGTGVLVDSNPAFRGMLGYTELEMAGLGLHDFVAHDPAEVRANLERILAAGHHHIGERQYRRSDGSLMEVEVDASRVNHAGQSFAFCTVQDITARKQAEAKMAQLVEILEATPDLVGIADPEGHALYGNHAMQAVRGLDSPDLARPIVEAHPAWAARIIAEEAVPTAIREGVWRGETAFLDREGREIPTSQIIVSHRGPDGNLTFLSTIARDISEQKRHERELALLMKGLRDLHFAVDETSIYAVTDARGVITEVNERFCRISGYRREELIGQTHRLIRSDHHPKAFFQEMWQTIKAGRTWRGEICNRAKDGTLYWVDGTIVPWLDAAGKPERYISLRWIITDRKRAEAALLHREAQLETLAEAGREINRDLDIRSIMRRLVEAALRLSGAADGTYGLLVKDHLEFREYLRGGLWSPIAYDFPKGYGVPGWVMGTLEPYLSNDAEHDPHVIPEIQRAVGFRNLADVPVLDRMGALLATIEIHNTTDFRPFDERDAVLLKGLAAHAAVAMENAHIMEERRRQEEALRHTQKLESLGLLAGGLAHDFNNLLSAILGNLSLALFHTPSTAKAYPHLQSIDKAVARAADLTRQMLAYSGKGTFHVKRMDLNAAVEEIARLMEASIPRKIQLVFLLQPALPGLEGDAAQIEQVILNLVTNAADAIGDREGHITLTTGASELSDADLGTLFPDHRLTSGPYLTLEVTDDGCGMTPEILERIFDPFFTTKTSGRGLGLSAMLGILRGHGGGLKVYSEAGRGSSFRIYLPAAAGPASDQAPHHGTPWTGHGRVLVADDDEMVRSSSVVLLELLGFEPLEARDGAEAVQVYREHRGEIALVLLDLSMPRMDGREALRAIRELDPSARVILCSGFEAGALRRDPGDVQPSAFIQKPFRFEDLRQVVREVLGQG